MKENTKKGSCYLNGLAIFLSIIFVISIFIAADNAIPLQAATAKSQSTTVANRSKVKKDKWTTLLQKYEKSKKVNQLIFVKYKGKSKANIVLYEKVPNLPLWQRFFAFKKRPLPPLFMKILR